VGERQRKAIENVVGGLIGFGVAAGLIGLAMTGLRAVGSDMMPLVIVLVTVGSGFAYGCVQAGMALTRMASLHVRFRLLRRAGRWEDLVPLGRALVEEAEWYIGYDDPRTVRRREGLCSLLLRLERFEEVAGLVERNVLSLSRRSGATHPDTVRLREHAHALRQAARDPALVESMQQMVRELGAP
jgi:hypothetical protein